MAKSKQSDDKKKGSSGGTRIIRDADTGQFVEAARSYASSNTASRAAAKSKLGELKITDRSGKLSKDYR
jgi:hypothetical protein